MTSEIPIIDVAPFLTGNEEQKNRVAEDFNSACSNVGFVVLTGHGIDPDLPDCVFDTARDFFDLPFDEKLKVRKLDGPSGAGYHPLLTEANDRDQGPDGPEDYRESFGLGRADRPCGAYNRWPTQPAALQKVCTDYYSAAENLSAQMARLCARALRLSDDYFGDKVNLHDSMMLLHHYPEQKTPPLPNQLRSGAHRDLTFFTLLRTERQHRPGGLQVRVRGGRWIDVPPIENSIIFNIGDVLMRWTNDRWLSTPHRVLNPPLEAGEESRRISMPFFFAANDDALIDAIPTCVDDEHPRRYEPLIAGQYRRERLKETYDFAKQKSALKKARENAV